MSTLTTVPGFANPVDDAQAVFRAALQAFSCPGVAVPLPTLPHSLDQSALTQGMLALALALCDHDTPLWLDEAADTPQTRHHLRFHCAAPVAEHPAEAAFAFIAQPETMPRLTEFNPGRADFPDRSATLVIAAQCAPGEPMGEPMLEITGPGIKGNDQGVWAPLRVSGLPSWFWADWEENHAAYPLGVDVLFVDMRTAVLVGLPRTARIRKK